MNLMHYVVTQAEDKNTELLKLPEEFKYLKEASQYSVECITSDIISIRDKLKAITEQVKSDDEFQQQISSFLTVSFHRATHILYCS